MKLSLALVGAAFVAASPVLQDATLEHAVPDGTVVTKTLVHSAEYSLVDGLRSMGDEEEGLPDEFSMEFAHAVTVGVTDTVGRDDDGRLVRIRRVVDTFEDSLEGEVVESFGTEPVEVELETELVEVPVVWSRGEDGAFTVAYEDEEDAPDASLLEGLSFDVDALGLLPPADANLREGWTVEASALGELLAFGGDASARPARETTETGNYLLRAQCLAPFTEELDGELKLKLVSVDEDTGLAVVELEGDAASTRDVRDTIMRLGEGTDDPQLEALESVEIESEFEFTGTLEWDTRVGHLVRLEVDAEFERLLEMRATIPQLGEEIGIELEFEGQASWVLEFEPAGE